MSSSRMTSNQEVTIRLVLCAVGVPDFTGVEDIFRLTVGLSKSGLSRRRLDDVACRLCAKPKQHVQVADIAQHLRERSTSGLSQ